MNAASIIDKQAFEVLKEVMEDELKDLIKLYIDDSDKRLAELSRAIDASDSEATRENAHSFKGASANIAATSLAEKCYQLESMGVNHDLANAQQLLSEIFLDYQQLKDYLLTQI